MVGEDEGYSASSYQRGRTLLGVGGGIDPQWCGEGGRWADSTERFHK